MHALCIASYGFFAGTFQARDNVAVFIQWARSLGLDQAVVFETDDLVKAKSEKHVLYWCVGRPGAHDVPSCPIVVQPDGGGSRAESHRAAQGTCCLSISINHHHACAIIAYPTGASPRCRDAGAAQEHRFACMLSPMLRNDSILAQRRPMTGTISCAKSAPSWMSLATPRRRLKACPMAGSISETRLAR